MAAGSSKKRKRDHVQVTNESGLETSKPSAVFKPSHGRSWTVSIALPGSIIANAQTHDQKTALAGQIARACAVFCVDEVVVFDDGQAKTHQPEQDGYTAFADPNFFLYHVLSYLETPPYLRKALFPMHPDLRTAGSLPSLDMPHHLKAHEWCRFREGVTVAKNQRHHNPLRTMVDCGLPTEVTVPGDIPENSRVTLQLPATDPRLGKIDSIEATAVSPSAPREAAGWYWGYVVRPAASLGSVFTECPYDGGYDMSIGTSERGVSRNAVLTPKDENYVEPTWKHMLVVFGGVAGLEAALTADKDLQTTGVHEVKDLFDRWINLVEGQGSRTIRTEEAVWIGLTSLCPLVGARRDQ